MEARYHCAIRAGKQVIGFPDSREVNGLLVDLRGLEPLTSSMPWRRATNYATGPCCSSHRHSAVFGSLTPRRDEEWFLEPQAPRWDERVVAGCPKAPAPSLEWESNPQPVLYEGTALPLSHRGETEEHIIGSFGYVHYITVNDIYVTTYIDATNVSRHSVCVRRIYSTYLFDVSI